MDAAGESLRSQESSSFFLSSSTHDQEQDEEEEKDRMSAPKRLPTRSVIHLCDGLQEAVG